MNTTIDLKETTKTRITKATMKALVYDGPGKIEWKEIPIPAVEKPTDALIKILKTTICGTDLGILKGKVPSVKPGTTLGHEGVGIVETSGSAVVAFKAGDSETCWLYISLDGPCG